MSDLDRIREGLDPDAEYARLQDRAARARGLKDVWWLIVKDGKEMERTGHGAAVRWARAGLNLDEPTFSSEAAR